jgi:hypothetical protein
MGLPGEARDGDVPAGHQVRAVTETVPQDVIRDRILRAAERWASRCRPAVSAGWSARRRTQRSPGHRGTVCGLIAGAVADQPLDVVASLPSNVAELLAAAASPGMAGIETDSC